jgi:hypothetical protein
LQSFDLSNFNALDNAVFAYNDDSKESSGEENGNDNKSEESKDK